MSLTQRLTDLAIVVHGDTAHVSGQLPRDGDRVVVAGRLGRDGCVELDLVVALA